MFYYIKISLAILILICFGGYTYAQTIISKKLTKDADKTFLTEVLNSSARKFSYHKSDVKNLLPASKGISGFFRHNFKPGVLTGAGAISYCAFSAGKKTLYPFLGLIEINYTDTTACNSAYKAFKARRNGALNYEVLTIYKTLRQKNDIIIVYTEDLSSQMSQFLRELKEKY